MYSLKGWYSNYWLSYLRTYSGAAGADIQLNREGIFNVLYDPPRFTNKVIALAKQQEEKEMKECTFQPTISEKSRKIVSRKRSSSIYL